MYNSAEIAEKIKSICKQKKISINQMLKDCEITKSFIYDLEKRNMSPSCDRIARIANYFDCSVDYLLGRTDNPDSHKL
ncbi:MAG: helix-turn-helix transcriptional regulator [Ruminococcus sp.]|nr:helix-turn-helix transcriptional regulator [Ruminococcus sp.]